MRRVGHELFIDERGRASGALRAEPWVGQVSLGASVRRGRAEIAYRRVVRGRAFAGQPEGDIYGSMRVSVSY